MLDGKIEFRNIDKTDQKEILVKYNGEYYLFTTEREKDYPFEDKARFQPYNIK